MKREGELYYVDKKRPQSCQISQRQGIDWYIPFPNADFC